MTGPRAGGEDPEPGDVPGGHRPAAVDRLPVLDRLRGAGARPGADPVHGGRRALRVAAIGGASILLAAGAHTLGGGALPPWWMLGVLTAFVGTAAVALTARRCRLPRLLIVLVVEQAGLHVALGLGAAAGAAGQAGSRLSPLVTGMPGMGSGPALGDAVRTGSVPVGSSTAAALGAMIPMLVAHLVATVATALLLAHGERLLWQLADRLVARIVAGTRARPTRRRPRPLRPAVPFGAFHPTARALGCAGSRAPPHGLRTAG